MGFNLFAALLLAMCMALPAPIVAKATEEVSGIEVMEDDETDPASNGTTEVEAEGASDSEQGDAPSSLSSSSDGDQSASLQEASGDDGMLVSQEETPAAQMVFSDGMAQPVFKYSDARAEGYTNANSELWRFCVYVESDYDTDLDGKCDLMKVYVQVPRAAVESGKDG